MRTKIYRSEQHLLFPLYPLTLSVNYPQENVTRQNGTDFGQIFIVSEGSCTLRLQKDAYLLKKGDMFFIPAYFPHEYSGTDDFKTFFMGFGGGKSIFEYFNISDAVVYKDYASPQLYAAFSDLYGIFSSEDEPLLCSRAFSLAVMFFSEALRKKTSPLEKVCGYLEENFSHPVTLEAILSVCSFSKSKLCRDFKRKYGMTVFEKLTEIRLEHALFMLENQPEMKVKVIAEKCGYGDESYFCRMFRRRYGKTPRAAQR